MIMKWEDLEVGDVIRATENVKRMYSDRWAHKDLTISSICIGSKIYDDDNEIIEISCGNEGYFYLNMDGTHRGFSSYGVFFEVVKLKEE